MYRFITAILFLFLAVGIANAVSYTATYIAMPSGAVNMSMIIVGSNNSYSYAISPQAVYAAENYLAGRLGQSYYAAHIFYFEGKSYGNLSYAYFTYNVPFANNTPSQRLLGITVSLNNTRVVGYIGPSKPYEINITESKAINISEGYYVSNGSAKLVGVFNNSNLSSNSDYAVAWAVTGTNPLKGYNLPGVYIDAQNGTVLGQFIYYSALNASSQPNSGYGTSGDFSMFYSGSQSQASIPSTDSQFILPLTIIAFAMMGLWIYFSRR